MQNMHSITRRKPLSTKIRNVDNFYGLEKNFLIFFVFSNNRRVVNRFCLSYHISDYTTLSDIQLSVSAKVRLAPSSLVPSQPGVFQ